MDWTEYAMLAATVAVPIVAVTGLFYSMMRNAVTDIRTAIKDDMKRIEGKVDKLSNEHGALARELSEVKGYLRAALPESPARG